MSHKNKPLQTILSSTVGILILAAILILINGLFQNTNIRLDCTEDKLYTLSDATRQTLKKLDKKLTIRYYYSKDVPQIPVALKNYANKVEDMLREYEIYANGNIKIEKLNPKPDTDAEDSANLDGVTGQGGSVLGLDDNIYLGIAIRCAGQAVALPFLSPERESLLEYDLTSAIITVTHPVKHKLGIFSAMKVCGGIDNPMMMMQGQGGMKPAWFVVSELKKEYDVTELQMNVEAIPEEIDLLLVIHPKEISEQTQFALDQFLLRGGRIIAFLDPLCVTDMQTQSRQPMQYAAPNASSTLDKLLAAWGIEFSTEKIVVDKSCATVIRRSANAPAEAMPTVLSLEKNNIDNQDPAMVQLSAMVMLNAGCFTGKGAEGLTKTVLLKSSPESQLLEKYMTQRSPDDILADFHSDNAVKELAIKLTGTFKTAFPNGKPVKEDTKKDETKEATPSPAQDNALKASSKPGAVVLIADADMLYDPFCVRQNSIFGQTFYQPINHNVSLVQNLIETLSGDTALFQIRSRGIKPHPFTRVKEMEQAAADKYQDEIKKFEGEVLSFQQELYALQQNKKGGDKELLSKEQKQAVANIRKKEAEARKKLKEVRKNMRKEISALENNVTLLNIGLMPLLVILGGILLAITKRIKA